MIEAKLIGGPRGGELLAMRDPVAEFRIASVRPSYRALLAREETSVTIHEGIYRRERFPLRMPTDRGPALYRYRWEGWSD